MVSAIMVIVFLAPIVVLLWAGSMSNGERRARVRDFDAQQAVRDPRAPRLADQQALGDQLFNPENTAPFRSAGSLLASRHEDGHHGFGYEHGSDHDGSSGGDSGGSAD